MGIKRYINVYLLVGIIVLATSVLFLNIRETGLAINFPGYNLYDNFEKDIINNQYIDAATINNVIWDNSSAYQPTADRASFESKHLGLTNIKNIKVDYNSDISFDILSDNGICSLAKNIALSHEDCPILDGRIRYRVTFNDNSSLDYISITINSNICGNGIIDINEECDSENLDNKDCIDYGYDSGELKCNECEWDYSECVNTTDEETNTLESEMLIENNAGSVNNKVTDTYTIENNEPMDRRDASNEDIPKATGRIESLEDQENNASFSFMFIGDDNYGIADKAIKYAAQNYPNLEAIFSISDSGWSSRAGTYNKYVSAWKGIKNTTYAPVFIGLGNHDIEVIDATNFTVEVLGPNLTKSLPGMKNFREGPYDIYPNGYQDRNLTYSFDYKNTQFLMINPYLHDILLDPEVVCGGDCSLNRFAGAGVYSPEGCISEDLLSFLEDSFKSSNATFRFLFYHEGAHPVPGGRHTGDSFDNLQCPGNSVAMPWANETRPMRERFWTLLARYNVTATFVGHSHHHTITLANDIYGDEGAIYEIEPGIPPSMAVINIDGETARIQLYESKDMDTSQESFPPIIIDNSNVNYPPVIYHNDAGIEKGFPVIEKRNYHFEVDQILSGLYFETKDNNIDDNISYTFSNRAPFLGVKDWSKQYRRISLFANLSSNKLTSSQIGNYNFDVIASDGKASDSTSLNITVYPAVTPVYVGANIPNNSVVDNVRYLSFFCRDEESGIGVGRGYERFEVYLNDTEMSMSGSPFNISPFNSEGWHSYTGVYFSENFGAERFEFKGDPVPGRYDLIYRCKDLAGHQSETQKFSFTLEDDHLSPSQTKPWVVGTYPFPDSSVKELPRISIWIDSLVGTTAALHKNTKVSVTKDGETFTDYYSVTQYYNNSLTRGNKDIIFNNPAEEGTYVIKVEPIVENGYHNYIYGENYTFTITVENRRNVYVDKSLAKDCNGTYSIALRNCSGSDGYAYNTISEATANASAGDNILIRAGIYNEIFRPVNSGTLQRPILYKRYNSEEVVIKGTATDNRLATHPDDPNYNYGPIWFENVNYTIVDSLNFSNPEGYGRITRSNNNWFRNCNFYGPTLNWKIGINLFESHRNKFVNNFFEGTSDNFRLIHSDRNVITGNIFRNGRHVLLTLKCSSYNIIRSNYFYNEVQKAMEVLDCEQPTMFDHYNIYYQDISIVNSTKHNLIENNTFAYTAKDRLTDGYPDGPFNGIQYSAQEGIIRNNLFYNNLGGAIGIGNYEGEAEYAHSNRIYHNVFYKNSFAAISVGSNVAYSFYNNVIKNNILYKNNFSNWDSVYNLWGWQNANGMPLQIIARTNGAGFLFKRNNIFNNHSQENHIIAHPDDYENTPPANRSVTWWQQNKPPLFNENLEKGPGFVNVENHDFRLRANSEMIDAGDFLTLTRSAGNGTNLPVEDALYFFDGFGIDGIAGDLIQIEDSVQKAKVIDIDYENKILILDNSLNWNLGKGVSISYTGDAPDIGAFENDESAHCAIADDCPTEACNTASCIDNICVYSSAYEGDSCNDGNLCNSDAKCSSGTCVGTPKNCSDSISCTADSCNPSTGECLHNLNNALCNDNFACTSNTCTLSGCTYIPDNEYCTLNKGEEFLCSPSEQGAGVDGCVENPYMSPSKLVFALKLDENESSILALDTSLNTRHGTLANTTYGLPGKFNLSHGFNGYNSYITFGNLNSVQNISTITVSAWVKRNSLSGTKGIITKSRSGFDSWKLYTANDRFVFYVRNQNGTVVTLTSKDVFVDNNWHHVVGIYNGSRLLLYVDGGLQTLSPPNLTGNIYAYIGSPVCIGGFRCPIEGNWFNGSIDEAVVFARALSYNEVQTLYTQGFDSLTIGCGDGITEPDFNEECDDNNLVSGDGCNSSCNIETPIGTIYKVIATASSGGTISPIGNVTVQEGQDITFTMIPNAGYVVKDITTSGVSEGAANSFTLWNVKENESIAVSFIQDADTVPEDIYVDNQLPNDCNGNYNIATRRCDGTDGKAYTSIIKAANVAGAGDTVLIRGGIYNTYSSYADNDVLWPKHSGTAQNPLIFKNYNNEEVVLGEGVVSYPSDYGYSISRGVISLSNVHDIIIEGLKVRNVAGWIFCGGCTNVTFRNNEFENALYSAKGTARFIYSKNNRIINNTFFNSTFDSLQILASDYNLIENNTFIIAQHSLMAIRCGNYNVIRNNYFSNPWYTGTLAEKLTEIYDCKLDTRDPASPGYIAVPRYDSTKYNLIENNLFGYHPDYPPEAAKGSRTSAIQFSGQNTIIRNNRFSNPPLAQPNQYYPAGYAGGVGIAMRWGGSWDGWSNASKTIVGEAHEAGFVHDNKIFNNVFYGYDNGKLTFPADNSMATLPLYAPMKNVENYQDYPFNYTWRFDNNTFKNNIFYEGRMLARNSWSYIKMLNKTPTQVISLGRTNQTFFENNDFYASSPNESQLIYYHQLYPYFSSKSPDFMNLNQPQVFSGNIQKNPDFVDEGNSDFRLKETSQMINSGAFLTKAVGTGSGTNLKVMDAGYFYDGFGIAGERGDIIQLEGSTESAQIVRIDYTTNILILNKSLIWSSGQGVSLAYQGIAPDIGAYEYQGTPDKRRTIYVDKDHVLAPACNNNWVGNITNPKCTIHDQSWIRYGLKPGDVVYLAGNASTDYQYLYIYPNSTGTKENPIEIRPYEHYRIRLEEGHGILISGNTSYIRIYGPLRMWGGYKTNNGTVTNYGLELYNCDINFSSGDGVRLTGVKDFILKNCVIHGRGYSTRSENVGVNIRSGNSSNILIENVEVYGMDDGTGPDDSDADGFYINYGIINNVTFKNCSAHHNSEDGFDLTGENIKVINSKAYNNYGAGIKIWRRYEPTYGQKFEPSSLTVRNSLIYNNGYYAPDPNQGNPGIKASWGAGLTIENSVIFNNYDQAIIVHYNSSVSNSTVSWCDKLICSYDDAFSIFNQPGRLPIMIKNSIIANTIAGPGLVARKSLLKEDHNIFFNNFGAPIYQATNYGEIAYSINLNQTSMNATNPTFIYPNGYKNSSKLDPIDYRSSIGLYNYSSEIVDFRLKNNSPAIDNGATLSEFSYDINNVSRPQGSAYDIGAYEYVSTPTPTCSDGIQNGDETGVDCGGNCPLCTSTVDTNKGNTGTGGGGSGGGGGGAGGSLPTYFNTTDQWSIHDLKVNDKAFFNFSHEEHKLYVDRINSNSVELSIYSERRTLTLMQGRLVSFDVDLDNKADIDFMLFSITNDKANIGIMNHINEKPSPKINEPSTTDSINNDNSNMKTDLNNDVQLNNQIPAKKLGYYFYLIIGGIAIIPILFFTTIKLTKIMHHSLLVWKYHDHVRRASVVKKVDEFKALKEYINNCVNYGYPKERIIEACVHVGWEREIVEEIVNNRK